MQKNAQIRFHEEQQSLCPDGPGQSCILRISRSNNQKLELLSSCVCRYHRNLALSVKCWSCFNVLEQFWHGMLTSHSTIRVYSLHIPEQHSGLPASPWYSQCPWPRFQNHLICLPFEYRQPGPNRQQKMQAGNSGDGQKDKRLVELQASSQLVGQKEPILEPLGLGVE